MSEYQFIPLTSTNLSAALSVYQANSNYFALTDEQPTLATVQADLAAGPPQFDPANKHFQLITQDGRVIGVIDLLFGYPEASSVYIGLLLIAVHNQGHGRRILAQLSQSWRQAGFTTINLAVLQNNPKAQRFWRAQGFYETQSATAMSAGHPVAVMSYAKQLDK
ncbi:N-acetyltransferase family protein [Lacticaseibacillus saniviri]